MSSTLFTIVFFACVLVMVNSKPMSEEERQAMYMELIGGCKVQEGSTDADVQEIVSKEIPTARSGHCLNACIFEKSGLMKDGKLSIEGCIKIGEMTGDPQRAKNVELVSRECESTVGTDRCDTAFQILQCVGKSAVAHGINPKTGLM